MKRNKLTLLAVLGTAWLAVVSGVSAQSIGVNYVSGGSGIDNSDADSLGATEQAGAPGFAQVNWNSVGRYGSVAASTLVDSTGATTPLFMNWDSVSSFSSGAYANLGTSDAKLMDGFVSQDWAGGPAAPLTGNSVYGAASTDKPLVFVGGLQAWMTALGATGYKIVLYVNGYHGWNGTSEHWIQAVTGNPLNYSMVAGADLTSHLFNADTGVFNGTYTQVSPTCTSVGARSTGGNYEVFGVLTNDEVLIRSSEPNGDYQTSTFFGYQIVPTFPTSPPSVSTPDVGPSTTVYAGSPVQFTELASGNGTLHYQWRTDGGNGGSLTNIPGATATNLMVVPPDSGSMYTINYDVVVANSFGASTSSVVTLTVNAATAPIIATDTTPVGNTIAYVGGTVSYKATFNGTLPIVYTWQSNSVNLVSSSNTTLTLANLPLSASATYQLAATNSIGGTVSSAATLTVVADPPAPTAGQPYAFEVFTNNPLAYYRLGETGDNVNNNLQAYDYSGHGFDAVYGTAVALNNAGPQSPAYPGFESGNLAAAFSGNVANGTVLVPPLNLNTNTFTVTAWIYPTADAPQSGGLFFNRNGNDAAGLGFGGTNNAGQYELGYVWNTNSSSTYNFNTGLFPPLNQWSFVALTITPASATIYLYYTDGVSVTNLSKAVNLIAHTPESFSGGTTWIGGDPYNINRTFIGSIDEVAVFSSALSESQLQGFFLNAIGSRGVPPVITSDAAVFPASTFAGQAVTVTASGDGAPVPSYQWQYRPGGSGVGSFVNVANNARISGANSGSLVITNSILSDATDYRLVVTNIIGSVTSSPVTVALTPIPANGLWTVNFGIVSYNNGAPATPYVGRGILGMGTYWNGLTGGNFTSSTSYQDDGSTSTGIKAYCTGGAGCWFSGFPMHNALLDPYCNYASGFIFTNVPNGTYNLAVFGIPGASASAANVSGTSFTVNGVTQNIVGTQDTYFVDGETATVFANVVVTDGGFLLSMADYNGATETDFNGAQLQAVSLDPVRLSTAASGSSLTLSWANYGTLLNATNLAGPWMPVAGAISPFTVTTTNTAPQFFRVKIH